MGIGCAGTRRARQGDEIALLTAPQILAIDGCTTQPRAEENYVKRNLQKYSLSSHLFSKLGILDHGILLVKLKAADSIEALEVEPASPPDAHSVQDHRGFQMQLQKKEGISICASRQQHFWTNQSILRQWLVDEDGSWQATAKVKTTEQSE